MRTSIQPVPTVIVGIVIAACAHVRTPPALERPSATSQTIEMSTYAGLLRQMAVTVVGSVHPFIFDTGGGETVITPELAALIGCEPYGRAIGFRASGEQVAFEYCDDVLLRLGDLSIPHERVGVFDLRSILPPGAPPAEGVVSLRSFREQPVTIDLAGGTLTLETASSLAARTARMRPLTIRVATGPTGAETTVYIAARVSGRRVWLLLDSGNGDPALVSTYVARTAGIQDDKGDVAIDFEGLGSIRVPVVTRNMIYDGMLGAGFMQDWILTLDLKTGRAWATPAPRPSS